MMDIKKFLLLSLTSTSKPQGVVLIMKLNKINNWLKNYTNKLLKKIKKKEFIPHLKTMFGVLI